MIKAIIFDCNGVLYADVGRGRNDRLLEYVLELRGRGFKTGLLSNAYSDTMEKYFFDKAEQSRLFDAVILSGDEEVAKPDPKIFALACHRLGVDPEETVMVDDTPTHLVGARTIGMKTVWYEDFDKLAHSLRLMLG